MSELEYPNELLQAKLARQQQHLLLLHDVVLACRGGTEPRQVFQAIYNRLVQVLPLDAFYVALCENDTAQEYRFVLFIDEGRRYEPSDSRVGGLTGYLLEYKRPLLFRDLHHEYKQLGLPNPQMFGQDQKRSRAWIGVPILIGPAAVGVLSVQSYQPDVYDQGDLQLLVALGDLAAIAIENAMLYQAQHERSQSLEAHVIARSAELDSLSAIAISFSQGQPLEVLLDQVLEHVVQLLELEGGAIFILESAVLRRVAWRSARGFPEPPAWLPVDGTAPEALALRTNQFSEEIWADQLALVQPLRVHDRTVGVLTLHGAPRGWNEHERMLLEAASHQLAIGVDNAQLYATAHANAQLARRHAEKLTLVHRISRLVSSSLDPQQVLGIAAEQLVNLFGVDHCAIVLYQRAGWHGRIAAEYPALGSLHHAIDFDNVEDFQADLQYLGQPIYIADILQDRRTQPISELALRLGVRSTLIVPLISHGRAIGAIGLNSRSLNHQFAPEDWDVCQTIAAQVAIALENARLFQLGVTRVEQEMEIARSIQANLFPRSLPQIPGASLAARCIPARQTGGDFYDVLPLGADRFGISIGDVSGKGMPAAMLMAVARSIVRSEALDHTSPEDVVSQANTLIAQDVPPNSYVALCYAIYDAQQRTLELTLAGQMTPLVRRGASAFTFADAASDLPLGMLPTTQYRATCMQLMVGDTVVFYTDGLVEAFSPDRKMFGFERLQDTLAACTDATADEIMDHLLTTVGGWQSDAGRHDDLTILILQLT